MTLSMALENLDVPKELEDRFEGLAKMKGTPKNSLMLTALEEWIEDQEDAAMADEVMAGIRAGTVKVYPAKEVWDRLGLGD